MTSHIGEIVSIANPYNHGLINNHVHVLESLLIGSKNNTYSAYARSQYNVGNGPEPWPADMCEIALRDTSGKTRGWGHIEPLCENVGLEEALRKARPEAEKRNVVLYQEFIGSETTILWHPDGWEPQIG